MIDTEEKLPPVGTEVLMLFESEHESREGDFILDEILEIKDGYMNLKNLGDWYNLPDHWVKI